MSKSTALDKSETKDTKSEYVIRDIDDLYDIIRTNEKWREALRRELLSKALLNLPEDFARFKEEEFKPLVKRVENIENDVAVLKEDVAVLKEDVAVLKEDVAVLKEDVAVLKQDVSGLKQDVASLKQNVAKLNIDVADLQGSDLERRVREKAAAYFGKIIRRCKTFSHDKLADILDDALDNGIIDEEMREDAILIDVVVQGKLNENRNDVVLAIEVSKVVDVEDVRRASRRASIIGKALNLEGIGVAFGKSCTEGAKKMADELDNVLIICQSSENS